MSPRSVGKMARVKRNVRRYESHYGRLREWTGLRTEWKVNEEKVAEWDWVIGEGHRSRPCFLLWCCSLFPPTPPHLCNAARRATRFPIEHFQSALSFDCTSIHSQTWVPGRGHDPLKTSNLRVFSLFSP